MNTIGDEVITVQGLLGGRSDKNAQISLWLANAYRDLATSIPFETLESTEDHCLPVSLLGEWPPYNRLKYPRDARAIKAVNLGQPAHWPTAWRPIFKRNIDLVDRYTAVNPSVPAIWAPFGRYMVFAPPANAPYPVRIRYWRKVVINKTRLNDTEIQLPDDWLEIVEYGAAMRGFLDLQQPDRSAAIRTLLYGNVKQPDKPGLIKQRLTRIQAEYMNANYGMRPRRVRYGFVP